MQENLNELSDAQAGIQSPIERENALLAAIVESSDDAITTVGTDLHITYWNRGAERLLGFTVEEALGQPFTLLIPPEYHAQAMEIVSGLMAQPDAVVRFEGPIRRKNGTIVEVSTVCVAIRDSEGKVVAISSIQRDITERRRAESEQAMLAALVRTSEDAIISYSTDFRITSWNRGAQRLLGYTAEEALGKRPFELYIPPADRAADEARLIKDLAMIRENGEAMRQLEMPVLRKDGAPLDAIIVGCGIHDANGNLIGLSTIIHDVTARKRAENQAAVLAEIVNSSQDAIINVSPDLRIASWNPAAEKAYGYTAEEAIGQGFELFVPAEELAETGARCQQVVETGQPVSWEQHARKRDGTRFISAVNIFPIRDALGNVTGIAGIGRDITALKETERELVAAREAALAASQAKSEFLSSMSHEIRTPMTAILGMAELLAEGELSAEQRRYIEILCNNGNTLLDLINSILDLAKVESGRLTLEHVGFDLGEVVQKSAQTLAMHAHAKGLELIVSIAPDVPTALLGDPLRLRQVLINLIGNAIKFTERGEVMVSVERDCAPGDPLRLKFIVRDTGIGIDKDKLPVLFAAFSQADSSTARKYGGSGLGLAIVKRLVTLMQGEVAIQSEPGKGSIFTFIVPFETQPDASAVEPGPDLAQVLILIVDANPTGRATLRRTLSGYGANVVEAGSYAAGLAVIKQGVGAGRPPRIMLVNVRIAAQDPDELAQLIAAASRCGASIIAMLQCDNLAADISRLRSLKLENYLLKPIDMRELGRVLRRVLEGDPAEVPQDHRRLAKEADQLMIVDRPLKILFADDSIDNRTLIGAFLKKTPYHLDEVENGRQAIDRFIAGNYDLVLMDIQMPEVDGYAATRAIRVWEREHNRARTPIVALTASVFSDAVRLAQAAGCDSHVGKPVKKATLLRAIYDAVRAVPVVG